MFRSHSMDWSPSSLSPNTAKLVLRKEKKIESLNVELRSEIDDKNELIEENISLKNRLDELQKQMHVKRLENSRMAEEVEDLNNQLEGMRQKCAGNDKISGEAVRLKEDLSILRSSKEALERENEQTSIALQKAEAKVGLQANVIKVLEEAKNVLELGLYDQTASLDQLRSRCKDYELEIADLHEYNRDLTDQLRQLESKKMNTSLPLESVGSLAHEVEFENMKERIAAITSDLNTIEVEQSKLQHERDNLSREKMDLEKQMTELNTKFQEQLNELNGQLDVIRNENSAICEKMTDVELKSELLSEENTNLKKQVKHLSVKSSEIKKKVQQLSEENVDLKKSVEQLSQLNVNLRTETEQLSLENTNFRENIRELSEKKQHLETTVTNMEFEKVEHEKQSQELTEKLRTSLEENVKLLEECNKVRQEVERYYEQKLTLETTMRRLISEKSKLENHCDEVNEKLTALLEDHLTLQKECSDLKDELEQLTLDRLNLEATVIDLKSGRIEFEKHSAKLNQELAALLAEKLALQEESRELREKISQLTEENLNLEASVIDQKSERLESERKFLQQFSAEKTNWETIVKELDSEKIKLEEQAEELTKNLTIAMHENIALHETCRGLKERIEQFSAAKLNLETTISELDSKKTEFEKRVSELNEQLTASSDRIDVLLKESGDLKALVQQLSVDKQHFETIAEHMSAENTRLERELSEKLVNWSRERAAFEDDVKNRDEKIELLSKDKLTLELTVKESQSKIMEAEFESQSMNEKLSQLEKELNEKLASLLREREALEEEVKNRDAKIELISKEKLDLELIVTESQSKAMEYEWESQNLNEKLSHLKKELNEKLAITLQERVALEEEVKKRDTKIELLSKDKIDLELIVNESRSRITEAERASQSLNAELSFLSDENLELRAKCENLENNISELTARKLDLEKIVEQLQSNLFELSEEKTIAESNLLRLNQEICSIRRQLEVAIVENKDYETSLSGTKATLQEKTAELSVATSRCSEVEKERDHYESCLRSVEKEMEAVVTIKSQLQEELTSARAYIEQSSEENARKICSLEEEIKNLTEEVNRGRSSVENSSNENEQLQAKIAELSELNERQSKMHDNFEKLLNEKDEELETKEKKMLSLQKMVKSMSEENCSLENGLKNLEQENVIFRIRIKELLKEKEGLYEVQKINDGAFHVQLESVSSKNATLSSENEKLVEMLKSLQHDYDVIKEEFDQIENKYVEELQKIASQGEEERAQFDHCVQENQKKEEQLRHKVQTLNVKLVEETDRANVMQRTHAAELQKRVEMIKSLESRLARDEERIHELKSKLEEAIETNELLTDEVKCRTNDYEMLEKENENLLVKVDDLETIRTDLRDACDRLQSEKDGLKEEQKTLSLKVDSMNEALASKDKDIDRLRDEYEIFKEEYRKLVQHKDELESEFKDTLLQEHNKLSRRCEELAEANTKMCEQLCDKEKMIETLSTKIEDLETRVDKSATKDTDLNETHVVASGSENEEYMNLRRENLRLAEERDSYKRRKQELEAELEKEKENYRSKGLKLHEKLGNTIRVEYEGKLERAKTEYQRKLSERFTAREQEMQKKIDELKTMLSKEKEHNKDLNSQNWNMMDQYLRLKQVNGDRRVSSTFSDNFLSPATLRKTKSATHLNMLGGRGMGIAESDRRMSSMSNLSGRLSFVPETDRRQSAMSTVSEDFAVPARKKPSTISAKVFPTEDEEQEIFDNACLADLKQGRVNGEESQDFSKERLSILQARNSLCPPHLKSSYPAETQFLPSKVLKEDEIKMGCPFDNSSEIDTLSLGDRQRKPRHQTTYKKPGPPTPSKNGGRSTTVQVETPKNVLRESNDSGGSTRRRSFTPKFLNNLFALRGHVNIPMSTRDNEENMPLTPKHTRLSSLRHRFVTKH